jgi:hypothetical protein
MAEKLDRMRHCNYKKMPEDVKDRHAYQKRKEGAIGENYQGKLGMPDQGTTFLFSSNVFQHEAGSEEA